MTKLISWNVNGIRAIVRKGYWEDFLNLPADIICIQETKASEEQLDEEVRNPEGFYTYFHSSTARKGYSGVAIYSKIEPKHAQIGIGIDKYDEQGRTIVLTYDNFTLVNVYVPNGKSKTAPLDYKMGFYDALFELMEERRAKGENVVMCGDINVAHEEIDLARPSANKKSIGFLPEERAWIDELQNNGYIDTFRHFYPDKKDSYSYWDMQSRARDRNVGWRIDYFFIHNTFQSSLKAAAIHNDVFGSDHCPISVEIDL